MSSFGETLVEKALGLLPRGKTRAKQGLEIYRRRKEHIHILTGILSGFFLGSLLSLAKPEWTPRERAFLSLPGDAFTKFLETLSLPLVSSLVISSVGSMRIRVTWKVIIGTAACFLCSALAIAVISLLSAAALKPGTWVFTDNTELGTFSPGSEEYVDLDRRMRLPTEVLLDLVDNTVGTFFGEDETWAEATFWTNGTMLNEAAWALTTTKKTKIFTRSSFNLAGAAFFSLLVGITAQGEAGEAGDGVLTFFESVHRISHILVDSSCSRLLPFALFFSSFSAAAANIRNISASSIFSCSLLTLHCLLVLPGLAKLMSKGMTMRASVAFMCRVAKVAAVAAITGSNLASLAVVATIMESEGLIDQGVASVVLCVGSVLNSGATSAVYVVNVLTAAQTSSTGIGVFGHLVTALSSLVLATSGTSPEDLESVTMSAGQRLGIPAGAIAGQGSGLTNGFGCLTNAIGLCVVAAIVQQRLRGGFEEDPGQSEGGGQQRSKDEEARSVSSSSEMEDVSRGIYRAFEQP